MAGIDAYLQSSKIECPAGTAQTMLQLVAAANQRLVVDRISASFEGIANTDEPILIRIVRQSTAGTGGDAVTPYPADEGVDETLTASGLEDIDGGDPTETNLLWSELVHPQGGFSWTPAMVGKEIKVKGGGRIAIEATADDAVDGVFRFEYEE